MDVDASDPLSAGEMAHLISASRYTLRRIDIIPFTPPEIFPVIFNLPRLQVLNLQEPRLPNQIPPEILPHLEAIDFNGQPWFKLDAIFRESLRTEVGQRSGYPMVESIQLPKLLDILRGATATMNVLEISPITVLDHSHYHPPFHIH
jgi:hypothetical protein